MSLEVRTIRPEAVTRHLDDLARLRIAVFREFPYLYDGDLAYERRYLAPYAESADAVVVGAFDGKDLVGAATGTPLADHDAAFRDPLVEAGFAADRVFYLAESVLLPAYRGQGVGHAFFDAREAHARRWGAATTAFCAVVRPEDHPERPREYRPLDGFWRARGYSPVASTRTQFSWREVGQPDETLHEMRFWARRLDTST